MPSSHYTFTRSDMIDYAFLQLNKFGEDQGAPDALSYKFANTTLNLLIKAWMNRGYDLWLKKTVYMFSRKGQNTYDIYSTSTDNCTLSYSHTNLFSNAALGATFVIVNSVTNINVNDYIGIVLSDNDIYWTQVLSKVGNQVNFIGGASLPNTALAGAIVYSYTTKLDNPLDVYSAVRNDNFIRDVPMNNLSYQEYFELPNKNDTTSTPVSYNYDRQLDHTIIRLWPTPDNSNTIIKLTISQEAVNLDTNSQEPEFPDQWFLALSLTLATLIAPRYGKNVGEGFANLKLDAAKYERDAAAFDDEGGSIYFKPDFNRG